uniref:Maturase-like protein 2 n=1 Tax=Euglena mutabilis TaxID=38275 RepID=A0A1B0UL15_EUGMU|nr:maturase-like protein 2 [Euglena mutabilis]
MEINKMLKFKFLSFSNTFLCRGHKDFSILSEYLFDIYMEDFSFFIFESYSKYNHKFFLVSDNNLNFPIFSSPIKLNIGKPVINLKKNVVSFYSSFSSSYLKNYNKNVDLFNRSFNLIRYKSHSIVFLTGSKKFSFFIKQKILSFIKSNLHFDVSECATCLFM